MYNKEGYKIRAKAIYELTMTHFEPENQAKCLRAVWRRYIRPVYGLGYHAFLEYIKYVKRGCVDRTKTEDKRQLKIDFDE